MATPVRGDIPEEIAVLNLPYEREYLSFLTSYAQGTALDLLAVHAAFSAVAAHNPDAAPSTLKNKLLQELDPSIDDQAFAALTPFLAHEQPGEKLSGGYHADQSPLLTTAAALYAHETGHPVAAFEIDGSNFFATNVAYGFAVETGRQISFDEYSALSEREKKALAKAGEPYTDRAVRIFLETAAQTIVQETGKKPVLARTGGDEFRFIVKDLDLSDHPDLETKIHAAIDDRVAALRLIDYPYGKAPEKKNRAGGGLACAGYALDGAAPFIDKTTAADERVKYIKEYEQGPKRTVILASSATQPRANTAAMMHALDESEHQLGLSESPVAKPVDIAWYHPPLTDEHTNPFLIERIRDERSEALRARLTENQISLSPQQEKLFNMRLADYPAIDHASGCLAERHLPLMMENGLERLKGHPLLDGQPPQLTCIGIKFHNLGGANKAFQQEGSNILLKDFADDIRRNIQETLGIEDGEYLLAHTGGGNFQLMLSPIVNLHTTPQRLEWDNVQTLMDNITAKTEEKSRKTTFNALCQTQGVHNPADDDTSKMPMSEVAHDTHGYLKGIQAVCTAVNTRFYESTPEKTVPKPRMGENINDLKTATGIAKDDFERAQKERPTATLLLPKPGDTDQGRSPKTPEFP